MLYMIVLKKKLQFLKSKLRFWFNASKASRSSSKLEFLSNLVDFDVQLDKGEGGETVLENRSALSKSLADLEKIDALDLAQKAKVQWAIEGDENSKYFNGIVNKKNAAI